MSHSISAISRRGMFISLAGSAAAGGVVRTGTGSFVDPRKVLLWESTRREFREALEGGVLKAMVVPTGSTEQHNEHLAMIHDTASVTLVARQGRKNARLLADQPFP